MAGKKKRKKKRLDYGPAKYAAFHLLLCRWMRLYAQEGQFRYVTLGGTEMRDIQSLYYIDNACMSDIVSYELKAAEHATANATKVRLDGIGLTVDLRRDDIFTFERVNDDPHLFFVDLKGCCAFGIDENFADLLLDNHLRPGDCLLVTTHLGFRKGWAKYLREYANELDTLEVEGEPERRQCFRRYHPSFTLYRALDRIAYQSEVSLQCFGHVEYRDNTPMSIFGYLVEKGETTFLDFVQNTPYFHVRRGLPTPAF